MGSFVIFGEHVGYFTLAQIAMNFHKVVMDSAKPFMICIIIVAGSHAPLRHVFVPIHVKQNLYTIYKSLRMGMRLTRYL